jgi:hypothetical protein
MTDRTDKTKGTGATTAILETMDRIRPMLPRWPVVLPSYDTPFVLPLAIGTGPTIMARVVAPEGLTPEEARRQVARAIKFLTNSYAYHRALAAPGAWRHDIDGNPVEPVSENHAEFARQTQPDPKKEIINVQIPAIKVTLPLRPDQLHPVDETVKAVDLRLDLGDGAPFTVPFAGKTYRRAMRQVEEMKAGGAEVIVLMQGRLVAGHRIEGAGLSVQARTPKVEA